MTKIFQDLQQFLSRRSRIAAVLLALGSLLAGLLEAVVLVLVVSAAVGIAEGSSLDVRLPMLGDRSLSPQAAVVLAGITGLALTVAHVGVAWLSAGLSSSVLRSVRDRVIAAFSSASTARQSADQEGALQETAGMMSARTADLVNTLISASSGGMGLVAFLGTALVIDPLVTVVVVGFGAVVFLILRPLGRATRHRGRRHVVENAGFGERVGQLGALAVDLRVFGVEKIEAERLRALNRATANAFRSSRFVTLVGSSAYRDVAVLALVGATGVLTTIDGLELASIGAIVILIVRALSYAQVLNTALQTLSENGPNLDLLLERIRSLEETHVADGTLVPDVLGPIAFLEVDYFYDEDGTGVRDLSFVLEAGETVGIVGPSGGGKSTLAQVLLRLRPPTSGRVEATGVAYTDISDACWRRLTTSVPQEPKLFQGTVAENIRFLRAGVSDEEVRRAAAAAHVREEIERLPAGFDTVLGPRGSGLSGGQKQRVAIARALVGEPQLLVLDEPTSALDVRSEQLLQETIHGLKGRMTIVIVAHRLTTLASCDRVIAMADGRIKAIGTLDEALSVVSLDRPGAG